MKDESDAIQEAYALYKAGMPGASLAVCEGIIAQDSHSAPAHYYAGFACLSLGRIDQAIAELREAVQIEPDYVAGYIGLASAYQKKGCRKAERQTLQQANTLTMPEWQRYMIEGTLAKAEGNYRHALECFRRAARDAPESHDLGQDIGVVLALMKRTVEARDVLRTACSNPAAIFVTWFNLGLCEQRLGDFEAASKAYERSLMLCPYYYFAVYRLMQVSFARRQWRRGFQQLRELVRMIYQIVTEEATLKQEHAKAEKG